MSESDQAEQTAADTVKMDEAQAPDVSNELPEEWKPEPREWTWKDLFTAPMLAFKPKCMLISVITLALIQVFMWVWFRQLGESAGALSVPFVGTLVYWAGIALVMVLFGIGATLVSVFFKADLLDDEFLSLGEALGQFKGRIVAALMVPLFLVAVVGGFNVFIWIAELVGHIPVVGGFIYAILYPLGVILSLFTVLITIGAILSIFVGPAVVAIRRHGWFDNVIDTFEAVGTKPHMLVLNTFLTLIMVFVCYGIGHKAMDHLGAMATSDSLPGHEISKVEQVASSITSQSLRWFDPLNGLYPTIISGPEATKDRVQDSMDFASKIIIEAAKAENPDLTYDEEKKLRVAPGGAQKVSGVITGVWKILISALIAGYALNIFLAGGMLTYLAVREDDYWDDEDLEDLDQLAKELEEEAKREEEAAKAAAAAGDDKAEPAPEAEEKKDAPEASEAKDEPPKEADGEDEKAESDAADEKKADSAEDRETEDSAKKDEPAADGDQKDEGQTDKEKDKSDG